MRDNSKTQESGTGSGEPTLLHSLRESAQLSAPVELLVLRAQNPEFVARVVGVFGSEAKATEWLTSPSPALQNQIPVVLIGRDKLEQVEIELGRIEHGIYV